MTLYRAPGEAYLLGQAGPSAFPFSCLSVIPLGQGGRGLVRPSSLFCAMPIPTPSVLTLFSFLGRLFAFLNPGVFIRAHFIRRMFWLKNFPPPFVFLIFSFL